MHRDSPGRAVSLSLVALLLLTACNDSPDGGTTATSGTPGPGGDSTATSGSTPDAREERRQAGGRRTSSPVPEAVASAASASAADYVDALGDALARPASAPASSVVAGSALEALHAQAEEYALSGWRIEGRPRVLSIEVYERRQDRMVIAACVDNSDVRVVRESGEVVSAGAGQPPTLNLLTLSRADEEWVVVDTGFPADPDC